MTALLMTDGAWLQFPPLPIRNSIDVIEAPQDAEVHAIAATVAADRLLQFAKILLGSANKRRANERHKYVNRSKMLLAKLLIERSMCEQQ
jgi:hypothetical protein